MFKYVVVCADFESAVHSAWNLQSKLIIDVDQRYNTKLFYVGFESEVQTFKEY